MKERKRKITIITVIGVMLILAITTFTYAIWSRTHIQTGVNKNTYACFEISYAETNGNGISIQNGYPQKDEDGLKNEPYEVQITNKCDTVSTYNVILNKEQGSTLKDEHLKVAVDNDYKLLSQATPTTKREISGFSNEASYIIGTGVVGPKQTKIVKIRSWMDKDTSETEGENKSFTFKITIETGAGVGDLKTKIFGKEYAVITEEPDFSKGYPNSSSGSDKSGLYLSFDDEGPSYYFRGNVENNYVQLGTNKENAYLYMVGHDQSMATVYGSYDAAENDCNNNYEIDYEYGSAQECIEDIQSEPMQTSNQPIMWRIVRINGDGTIRLVTDNPVGGSAFNETYNGYQYVGYTYENSEPCTHDKPCSSDYSGNSWTNSENMGTNSTIKGYLEDWYNTTLKDFNDKIALTSFCNDTSYGSGSESSTLYYGPYKRLNTDKKPSLQCPDPTKQSGSEKRNYGGVYKLKVGLLTADEMNMAGMSYNGATRDNYLLKYLKNNDKYYWWMWSMSPYSALSSNAIEFYGGTGGGINDYRVYDTDHVVRPVINLNADTLITSGDGSQNNPFIVG